MPGTVVSLAFRSGEWLSYLAGVLLTGFFLVQLAQGEVQRQEGIAQFEQRAQQVQQLAGLSVAAQAAAPNPNSVQNLQQQLGNLSEPDTSLWAAGRIADYQASLEAELPPVLGVLEIPSVDLKVPLYATDSELVMDRGAGVIDGMSYPHEPGNIGIAGHRDGYFRVLKDVRVGDKILLQTLQGPKQFRIDATQVVEISDKALLRDTRDQTVTLVTCYPFYFVGHAPQRFVVTASLDSTYVNQN